jgi:hypothetical protein
MSFSPKGKHHSKTVDKIRIACRLELLNLGIRDQEIAAYIGMSSTSYSLLKKTKVYQKLHLQYLTGVLSDADIEITNNFQHQRAILARGVPIALENLLRAASQRVDSKLNFEASKELLDRHGVHAKVSRIGLPNLEQDVATPKDNEVAQEILQAYAKAQTAKANEVQPAEVTIDSPPATEQTQ